MLSIAIHQGKPAYTTEYCHESNQCRKNPESPTPLTGKHPASLFSRWPCHPMKLVIAPFSFSSILYTANLSAACLPVTTFSASPLGSSLSSSFSLRAYPIPPNWVYLASLSLMSPQCPLEARYYTFSTSIVRYIAERSARYFLSGKQELVFWHLSLADLYLVTTPLELIDNDDTPRRPM